MKKRSSEETAQPGLEPNVADLFSGMQQQIAALEKKIDMLISQSAARPAPAPQFSRPFQHHAQRDRHDRGRQDNIFRDRVLHKAVCADCRKECEVPFKPTGDRPVYCKECFSKRKDSSPFQGDRGGRKGPEPGHSGPDRHQRQPFYKKFEDRRPKAGAARGEKRKPAARKRRKTK